ncbi:MAG: putative DNA binding domain-containing protein [Bacteroidetes bacterium]|nr:putative DNA binding domain-containing protein [Bacteroidota bacterium]
MKVEQHLMNIIKKGEGEHLEFMKEVRREDVAKTLCAFLNNYGGTVLIGVQPDGTVTGLTDLEKHEANLKNYLFDFITPNAPIMVSTETIANKKVIVAKVWNGLKPPYVCDGIIYFRHGTKTDKALTDDISKFTLTRQKSELHWESQPAIGIEMVDLDELEIRKTLKALTQSNRGKVFSEKNILGFLEYYGLYRNSSLTNAAVVLFAKEPSRYLPQCRIRVTVFKGTKSSDTFIYDRILEGNLFRNFEEIMQFFEVNIAVKSKFSDKKWLREDIAFPKSALREGLMNALIHRDYSNVSGSVIVAFYPDHLEITNYGELPVELKPSDLFKNHLSLPRNPHIAHVCFLREMIEKIGRGAVTVIEDCESKGYPKPKWQSKSGVTTLIFPEVTITAKTDNDVNDDIFDALNENLTDLVKVRLIGIMHFIDNHKGTKVSDLIKHFNVSERTIKDNLKSLIDSGLVIYKGSKRTGFYILNEGIKDRINN